MLEHERSSTIQGDAGEAEFVRLLVRYQRRVFAYIFALVPHRDDAEDILQEACTVLWARRADFQPGTDFLAWACRVAYWEVRQFRTKQARQRVRFSQPALDMLAERLLQRMPEVDERQEALRMCLSKLSDRDRQFVLARYEPGGSVAGAAQQAGRSMAAAYKSLARIRRALTDCVANRLLLSSE